MRLNILLLPMIEGNTHTHPSTNSPAYKDTYDMIDIFTINTYDIYIIRKIFVQKIVGIVGRKGAVHRRMFWYQSVTNGVCRGNGYHRLSANVVDIIISLFLSSTKLDIRW